MTEINGKKELIDGKNQYSSDVNLDLSQVEVQAIFELGRTNIPLYDVNKLAEGYTFVLDSKIDNSVHITVNGKCIASGILVRVNDNVGVRITKVFV